MPVLFAIIGVCLSWLMPLHFPPWVSWHAEIACFAAALLLSWWGLYREFGAGHQNFIRVPAPVLMFVALALLAAAQVVTGQMTFAGDALVFGFYMFLCVICIVAGYGFGAKFREQPSALQGSSHADVLTTFAFVIVFGAFASAVIAFAQVFDVSENDALFARMPAARRPGANMAQPNHLATLLVMGVASLTLLYERGKLHGVTACLLVATLLIGVAATESRTGAISLFFLLIWWFAKKRVSGPKLPASAAVAIGMGFAALFLSWPMFLYSVLGIDGAAQINTSAGTRFMVWSQLAEAVLLKPWAGWGIGQMVEAHNTVVHRYAYSEAFSYSHSILLDMALGVGLPMTFGILATVGVWLWRRVFAVNDLASWYCLAGVLPIAVHSLLEFPFAYAYFLGPAMFLIGNLEASMGIRPAPKLQAWAVFPPMLVATALMAWSVIEYIAIEEDFRVVRFEALRIGKTADTHKRPDVFLLTQLDALLKGGRIVPKTGMTAEELDLAKRAALRYPWTATQNRYALSLALNGQTQEAVRQIQVIRALHGESMYQEIKSNWAKLGEEKYPQLADVALPD